MSTSNVSKSDSSESQLEDTSSSMHPDSSGVQVERLIERFRIHNREGAKACSANLTLIGRIVNSTLVDPTRRLIASQIVSQDAIGTYFETPNCRHMATLAVDSLFLSTLKEHNGKANAGETLCIRCDKPS
ncbi:hypothetical protein V1477_014683 [Vespula maculifrons]|uniref:Uncharacterized protein n=1 Tax=Vespula maculifrons TaxID=7453 RepID=A0ABD2BI60_VESMC